MINRLDLRQEDLVIIHGLGDGLEYTARICGKGIENVIYHYIVELTDDRLRQTTTYPWTHALIPETCLKRV
jgi:hypothetical protein